MYTSSETGKLQLATPFSWSFGEENPSRRSSGSSRQVHCFKQEEKAEPDRKSPAAYISEYGTIL